MIFSNFYLVAVSKVNLPIGETKRKVPFVKVSHLNYTINTFIIMYCFSHYSVLVVSLKHALNLSHGVLFCFLMK